MENLTGGTPPVRYLPCVVPCKLYFTPYESTNPRRFVTGLAFGYGFLALFLYSCLAAYRFGYSLTH